MLDFDKKTKERKNEFLKSEKKSHRGFEKFNGSWMCSYDVSQIESKDCLTWISKLVKNHHSVIFTVSNNKGIAFEIENQKILKSFKTK